MILYHGTTHDFQIPDLSKGRTGTDFGAGFYLTDNERMADDWLQGEENKHINVYELTLAQIPSCHLHIRRYESPSVEWAKFVYNCRRNRKISSHYDIIIGPLADNALNKWFAMIEDHLLSWDDLADQIAYKKYNSLQFCFKTSKSIKLLEYASRK